MKLKEKEKVKRKLKLKSRLKLKEIISPFKILDNLKFNLGVVDFHGQILYINKALAKLLGYKPQDIINSPLHKFLPAREIQAIERGIKVTLKVGHSIDASSILLDKKGREIPISLSASVLKKSSGQISGILIIVTDTRQIRSKISKLKLSRLSLKTKINEKTQQLIEFHHKLQEMNKELRASKEKALDIWQETEEGEILKSILLTDLASQLKAPLTSIVGFVDIILNKLCHDRQRELEFVTDIRNYTDYLLRLLDELLDLVRIEQGQMKLELEKIDLFEIYCNLENLFKAQIEGKTIELSFIFPYEPLPAVYVDKGKLKQIMINILNISAKYVSEGSIIVKVTPEYKQGLILTQVESLRQTDPDEDSEKIIQRCMRIVELKESENSLGLQMSKKLIELMGGELDFEVTPDRRKMRLGFGLPVFGFKQESKPKLI